MIYVWILPDLIEQAGGNTGTYAGVVEKLDYLKRLGVNAIELLPVHEFNELEYYAVRTCHRTADSYINQYIHG